MTTTKRPLKTTIIVNRHIVKANKKASKTTGKIVDEPAISVRTSKGVVYGKKIEAHDGSWMLIQDAENARCSGATIWLEASNFHNLTIDGKKACLSMFPQKQKKSSPQIQLMTEEKKARAALDIARRLIDMSGQAPDRSGKRALEGKTYRIEESPQGLTISTKDRGEILSFTNDKLTSKLTSQDIARFSAIAKQLSAELKQSHKLQSNHAEVQR